jgi:hypothetical protein
VEGNRFRIKSGMAGKSNVIAVQTGIQRAG